MKNRFMSKMFNKASLIGLATFALIVASTVGVSIYKSNTVEAGDCSVNSIVKCGVNSAADVKAKSLSGPQRDVPTIFAHYGLALDEYDRFVSTARYGMSYRNGTIVVDGRVVASNTSSIGRTHFSYAHAKSIGGTTYWESATTQVQQSDMPVMVMFNAQGQMEFAVLYDCGNPINGTLNNPTYSCDNLNIAKDSDTTYRVSTSASAGNGAAIDHVVYNFGDGTTETRTNPVENVSHTYAAPGNYQVSTTVYVKVPGAQTTVIAAAGNCVKAINVPVPPAPAYACSKLAAALKEGSKDTYDFSTYATVTNGAKITKVVYNFGDGNGKTQENPASINPTATVTHKYDDFGTFKATATVYASPNNAASTNVLCETTVKIVKPKVPVYACETLNVTRTGGEDDLTYSYSISATTGDGAKITKVTYDFGDGETAVTNNPSSLNPTESVSHTYAKAGKYSVKAVVEGTPENAQNLSRDCAAQVTITEKPMCTVPGKEHLPPNSPECYENCTVPGKEHLPKDSPECVETPPAPELPSTGAGDTVGIFAGLSAIGGISHYLIRSRRYGSAE